MPYAIRPLLRAAAYISAVLVAIYVLPGCFCGKFAKFSAFSCFAPLAGDFGGFPMAFLLIAARHFLGAAGLFFPPVATSFYHLPTFFASAYWGTWGRLVGIAVPVVCFVAFVAHPVGRFAVPYTIYWAIPLVISLFRPKNSFFTALGSTFTAHAVGSTLWLYMFQSSPAYWLGLIPVVAVERLCMASAMTVGRVLLIKTYNLSLRIFECIRKILRIGVGQVLLG